MALGLKILDQEPEDLIPIDKVTRSIQQEAAVSVAVEGDAGHGARLQDLGPEGVQMGAADAHIDPIPVFGGPNPGDAFSPEQGRGPGGSGTVGAVHHQADFPGQCEGAQVGQILLNGFRIRDQGGRPESFGGQGPESALHGFLVLFGELFSLVIEALETVVLRGVVAGADHQAPRSRATGRDPGHCGGGHHAQHQDFQLVPQPLDECLGEGGGAVAGVPAQDHLADAPASSHFSPGLAPSDHLFEGEGGNQGLPPDAVRSEIVQCHTPGSPC